MIAVSFELFGQLFSLTTSDLDVHNLLHDTSLFFAIDSLWAMFIHFLLECSGFDFERVYSFVVCGDVTVDAVDVLHKVVVVQHVNDHDVEEEEHDDGQEEAIDQDVLVVGEGVKAKGPEACAHVADQAENVVDVHSVRAQVDVRLSGSSINLSFEGADPAHDEQETHNNENRQSSGGFVRNSLSYWQVLQVDSFGLDGSCHDD